MPDRDGSTGRVPVLLVLVLLLVLGAFALLITALVSGVTRWAWGSVAASAAAGALLIVDWAVRRRDARLTDRIGSDTVRNAATSDFGDTNTPPVRDTPGEAAVERTEPPLRRSSPTEPSDPAEG